MQRKVFLTSTLLTVILAGVAQGAMSSNDSVLLATMNAGVTVGSRELFEARWPALVYLFDDNSYKYPLFEADEISGPFPVYIDDIVDRNTDPDFENFVDILTDGNDDGIVIMQWGETGLGAGGGGGLESGEINLLVPAFGPDLVGYDIDYIRRILTIDIQSPGTDPLGDGIWTDWVISGNYEFYGSVVPEPTSFFLVTLLAVFMLKRNHQ